MKKDKTSAKFGFCKPNLVNVVEGEGGEALYLEGLAL